jgi:hypothetical protein
MRDAAKKPGARQGDGMYYPVIFCGTGGDDAAA